MRKALLILALLVATDSALLAAEEPSLDRGRELFESNKLGTSGRSCATCHPGGKKLEWAATFEEERLATIVNNCVKKAIKGNPIPTDSSDMKSILMYIKTFAGPDR